MSRNESLVTVATFATSMEASLAKGALEAAGIPALASTADFGEMVLGGREETNTPAIGRGRRASRRSCYCGLRPFGSPAVLGSGLPNFAASIATFGS